MKEIVLWLILELILTTLAIHIWDSLKRLDRQGIRLKCASFLFLRLRFRFLFRNRFRFGFRFPFENIQMTWCLTLFAKLLDYEMKILICSSASAFSFLKRPDKRREKQSRAEWSDQITVDIRQNFKRLINTLFEN